MNNRLLTALTLAGLALASAIIAQTPTTAPAPQPSAKAALAPAGTWDDYKTIAEKSIFSKDRSPPRTPTRPTYTPPVRTPEPASRLVLTAIVRHGDLWVAFFEDSRTGRVRQALAGQSIDGGTIKALRFDEVDYEIDGQVRQVRTGQDLSGLSVALGAPSYSSPSYTPSASTTGSSGPDGGASNGTTTPATSADTASLLERLRQRRAQEGN